MNRVILILTIIFFPLICSLLNLNSLFAENYMELIWEQQGEFNESEYGYSVASIDFNGDGIDDLIIGSDRWNPQGQPNSTSEGKVYFYWGGTNFDNIPDLTMDGSQYGFSTSLGRYLVNLGDINGDGYEDLGSLRLGNYPVSGIRQFIEIYYGGSDCDTVPDFEHLIYFDEGTLYSFYLLGDVNDDGYDDAGYVIVTQEADVNQYYIIYGGETPQVEYWNTNGSGGSSIRGIGNINNDEYEDFIIGFMDIETQFRHNVIFYGDTVIDTLITDTLYTQTVYPVDTGGAHAGDYNGDGTDDFIGCWSTTGGTGLWLGSDELNSVPDVILPSFCSSYGDDGKCFGFGDLNNDGFSDLILCSPIWSNHQGKAYFYIGDEYANGSIDLDIPCPAIVGTEFGTSVAVGDFNNDGFDDAVIGAPKDGYPIHEGKVYVYAGNDSLEESTPVSIHEGEIPAVDGIELNNFPNPFNPSTTIEFSIQKESEAELSIYNIKGQIIKSLTHDNYTKGSHSIIWNGNNEAGDPISSGIYFYKLNVNGKAKAVKKCLLLK